jgi:hypothetical protein
VGGELVFFVVVAVVFGFVGYLGYQQQQKRYAALARIAASVGFTYTRGDPERLVDMPFSLFQRGSRRSVESEIAGVHDGVNMRLFDYKYYVNNGGRSGKWYRFTCGLATIPAACPDLHLGHEGFFGSIENSFGAHDIQFESDEFNKRFRVKCRDQKFAFSLINGQMMEWLLGADVFNDIEIVGPWVLFIGPRSAPELWLNIGRWLCDFHARVPHVVYSQYPAGAR